MDLKRVAVIMDRANICTAEEKNVVYRYLIAQMDLEQNAVSLAQQRPQAIEAIRKDYEAQGPKAYTPGYE